MFEKKNLIYNDDYSHWVYHVTYILRWMDMILNYCFSLLLICLADTIKFSLE